jgi:Zn-dependent protease
MRNPRWGSFWTSFAGPLANLGQAIIAAIVLRLIGNAPQSYVLIFAPEMMTTPLDFIRLLLAVAVVQNVIFFVFNILPLAPLDGWTMMLALLPAYFLRREQVPAVIRQNVPPLSLFLQQPASKWRDWYQLSSFLLIALFLIGMLPGLPSILGSIVGPPSNTVIGLLLGF